MTQPIYAAIHIISENSDHYNLLLVIDDIKNISSIKKELKLKVSESPYYWSNYYVTTDSGYYEQDIYNIILGLKNENNIN